MAERIEEGSSGHTAMISGKSGGMFSVSVLFSFRESGVNCSLVVSQVFVLSGFVFLMQRTENPCVGGSNPPLDSSRL